MITAITMNPDASPAKLRQTVQLAEEMGISYCYVADQGFSRDIYVILTMLALATKRIHLGPGVTHPYTRHPVATAVAIASLDEFSGGRAFLGLGAGGSRSLVPMHLDRVKPMTACRETAEIARLLWKGKTASYRGKFFNLENASLNFPTRPDIEIHWAARGPKMLDLGGMIADVVLIHGIPHFELSNVIQQIRNGAARTNNNIRLHYAITLVYDDVSRESARMRTVYRLVDSTPQVQEGLGLTNEVLEEMRRLVTTKGPKAAAHMVSDAVLSNFTWDVEAEDCVSELNTLVSSEKLDGLTFEVPKPDHAKELLLKANAVIQQMGSKGG